MAVLGHSFAYCWALLLPTVGVQVDSRLVYLSHIFTAGSDVLAALEGILPGLGSGFGLFTLILIALGSRCSIATASVPATDGEQMILVVLVKPLAM